MQVILRENGYYPVPGCNQGLYLKNLPWNFVGLLSGIATCLKLLTLTRESVEDQLVALDETDRLSRAAEIKVRPYSSDTLGREATNFKPNAFLWLNEPLCHVRCLLTVDYVARDTFNSTYGGELQTDLKWEIKQFSL